jgi:DNA primase
MSVPARFLDELRFRVRLSDVVGKQVRLVRAGREWKACCPFHDEKTPSFSVNDEKGFYHCFGCGAHGDVIRFVCEKEGLSFLDSVRKLADLAGLTLPQANPEDAQKAAHLSKLYDALGAAQRFFADQLAKPGGAQARAYLASRGVEAETAAHFGLGFAPAQRQALKNSLQALGFSADILQEAGLTIVVEDKSPYDRFRGRLMFPIKDARGRVIGFGGRILGTGEPKYLNSPDTPLFDKGRTLYNLDQAALATRKQAELFVVEGYMDVIALSQAGIGAAVAPLGTALTLEQMALAWRIAPEPIVCLDGDSAGQRAAQRAAQRALGALKPGHSLRFMTMPQGIDPDVLLRTQGLSAFQALKLQALPLIDVVWQHEQALQDFSTPERRADFKKRLFDLARQITDPTVRQFYQAEFQMRLQDLFGVRTPANQGHSMSAQRAMRPGPTRLSAASLASPAARPPSPALRRAAAQLNSDSGLSAMIRTLLLCAIRHPNVLLDVLDKLADVPCESAEYRALRDAIVFDATHMPHGLDSMRLKATLEAQGYSSLLHTLETQDRLRLPFSHPQATKEAVLKGFCQTLDWINRTAHVEQELAQATAQLALEASDDVFARQQQLAAEKRQLDEERRTALTNQ